MEAYKYTKTAVALHPEWYSVLDQFVEYTLDLLDSKDFGQGIDSVEDDIAESLVIPACYGE